MTTHQLTCIVCPMGCQLEVVNRDGDLQVTGNGCKRGVEYGEKELTHPTRVLTTTVKINNGLLNRLPVVTDGEIPKNQLFEAMEAINQVEIEAPIKMNDMIIENILNTGVNIIASRNMERVLTKKASKAS